MLSLDSTSQTMLYNTNTTASNYPIVQVNGSLHLDGKKREGEEKKERERRRKEEKKRREEETQNNKILIFFC